MEDNAHSTWKIIKLSDTINDDDFIYTTREVEIFISNVGLELLIIKHYFPNKF